MGGCGMRWLHPSGSGTQGCEESGQGQRERIVLNESLCATLFPTPSNLALPCRDRMGQLGSDINSDVVEIGPAGAKGPGNLGP